MQPLGLVESTSTITKATSQLFKGENADDKIKLSFMAKFSLKLWKINLLLFKFRILIVRYYMKVYINLDKLILVSL